MGVTAGRISRLPGGVSYRQLDYWASLGYLRPLNGGNPGTGYEREWTAAELRVAETIARLRRAGLDLRAAARVARAAGRAAQIAPGVTVVVKGSGVDRGDPQRDR